MGNEATLRGLLTVTRLYTWHGRKSHTAFQRETGIDGVRLRLAPGVVYVNEETAAFPEHFPWIFGEDRGDDDVNERRKIVADRLAARLADHFDAPFTVDWYS